METNINTLITLAEVTVAFVAFATIVASLRVTLGQELTPFQKLLVQFFTESGMITVSFQLFPLVLAGFLQDELTIAWYSILYALVITAVYLPHYVRRRIRISAPTPLPSLLVMIGYGSWVLVLAIVGTGIYWQPSLVLFAAFCFWCLFSAVVIFASFLASFVQTSQPSR